MFYEDERSQKSEKEKNLKPAPFSLGSIAAPPNRRQWSQLCAEERISPNVKLLLFLFPTVGKKWRIFSRSALGGAKDRRLQRAPPRSFDRGGEANSTAAARIKERAQKTTTMPMDESLLPPLHDVIHASEKRLPLLEIEGSKKSLSAFSSPFLLLSLSFFYLRFFQPLPTPQLLPDPRCSSPLLFLLIYLLCAQNLLVRCLLILSSSRYCPQSQRIGCSSSSSSSSSSRTPRTPLSPSNQNHCMLKNEIEGKEAKMERSWYDKGRGPFRPPPPPHHALPRGRPLGPSSGFTAPSTYGLSVCRSLG